MEPTYDELRRENEALRRENDVLRCENQLLSRRVADLEAQVEKDKAEGAQLGIRSTPTIFVNGRLFSDNRDADSLRDWITEELGR